MPLPQCRRSPESQNLANDEYNAPIIADLDNVKPLPEFTTPKFGDCVEKFYKEEIEQVFLSGKDVQTAMDDAVAKADACLAE